MRFVGGPLDGRDFDTNGQLVEVGGFSDMAYHRTRPTDTNWREQIDPDWWMKGLPEPILPDHVMEWHETDWQSPEVRMVRDAIREAM